MVYAHYDGVVCKIRGLFTRRITKDSFTLCNIKFQEFPDMQCVYLCHNQTGKTSLGEQSLMRDTVAEMGETPFCSF